MHISSVRCADGMPICLRVADLPLELGEVAVLVVLRT